MLMDNLCGNDILNCEKNMSLNSWLEVTLVKVGLFQFGDFCMSSQL